MKFGYVRCAALCPEVKVAEVYYNVKKITELMEEADRKGVFGAVFPEMCITGYSCGDLFLQKTLLEGAVDGLFEIKEKSRGMTPVFVVGLPLSVLGKLYNTAAVIYDGEILGIVPKTFIPNYNEFYEKRYFETAPKENTTIDLRGEKVPFGTRLVFMPEGFEEGAFAVEICEDLWACVPPSSYHALAGAAVIFNPSAGNEITGKAAYRRDLVKNQSARLIAGYVYSCAGEGESTTDVVYSGHRLICENGRLLAESKLFDENNMTVCDLDLGLIDCERRRNTSFETSREGYEYITFPYIWAENNDLLREIDPAPFVPSDEDKREERCREIIAVQAAGLKKRLLHVGVKDVVIGVSGGLDSTHALLIAAEAFHLAGLDVKGIHTVSMPCFGTSERTRNNATGLCEVLGTSFEEVKIADAVRQHFKDIGHNEAVHDLTYENSQARERTQVLMDLASRYGGFVIGTGDLSELALGFATYNGDHMSMYNVNCSIPKTLIRYLIKYFADFGGGRLKEILYDILDTPVSPELLPPNEAGAISQVTEDIVGPYELHDFFLYCMMRTGFPPEKIFYLANVAFKGKYDEKTILKWLKKFYYRFFAQQYKRSAVPDGPKVGSVSLSPRGDWRMPSDACVKLWINSLEKIIV
ncbi:MAG: NAD(+) synthase [Clostridiales bacterium]|nr:NAD(+) synthase [Clostridiales bacterium]